MLIYSETGIKPIRLVKAVETVNCGKGDSAVLHVVPCQ